jgi:hypothetical protein
VRTAVADLIDEREMAARTEAILREATHVAAEAVRQADELDRTLMALKHEVERW